MSKSSVREYAILYVNGKALGAAVGTAAGGNVVLNAGVHALDGPEHTGQLPADRVSVEDVAGDFTATDVEAALAELFDDIAAVGADFVLKIEGGQDTIKAHGSMGATETFDPTDGNVHTGTLDANCTFTLSAPVGSGAATLELYLTQDGTGSRIVTWPGSVVWPGGVTPTLTTTADATDRIILETLDGGTTWFGVMVGSGGTGSALTVKDEGGSLTTAATSLDFVGPLVTASGTGGGKTITVTGALDDLTDVTITSAAAADRLRYNGSAWVNSAALWVPVMVEDGATGLWYVVVTGSGDAVMTEVS